MTDQHKTKAQLITELALRESEERYRAVFETISDFAYIVQVKPDGTRLLEWVTPVTSRITGYDPVMLQQPNSWQQLTHPDDWPIVQRQIDELLANRSASVEYRIFSASGEVRWVIDHAQPEWDEHQQRVSRFYGALQDITERKLAERNLELLAQAGRELSTTLDLHTIYLTLHRIVQQAMPCEFVFVSSFSAADQLIRCVYGNGTQGEFDVSEFPPILLEAEGRGTQSLVIRSGQPLLLNDFLAYMKTASTSYLVTENGTLQSAESEAADQPRSALIVPLILEGQVVGVIQVLTSALAAYVPRDLQFLESLALHVATALTNARLFAQVQTELAQRQRTEAALRESEQKFRSFVAQAAVGLSLTAEDGHLVEWNEALAQITGIPRAQALDQSAWDVQTQLVSPERREQHPPAVLRDLWLGFVQQCTAARTAEVPLFHPQQGLRTIEETVFPINTEHGRLIGQMVRDVTDQRRLETRYRLLFNEMQDGFGLSEVICDEAGSPIDLRILEVNPAFERLTGLRAADVIGHTLREVVPDIHAYWINAYGEVALTRRPTKLEGRLSDGGRYFNVTAFSPQRGQVATIFQDTTEHRQAERQLRLHGAALEAAANGIIITDRTGAIEWANPAFTTLTGYTLAEIVGRNPRDLIRSGQQSREFYRNLWDTILGGRVWNGEIINRRKDGRLFVEETTITPVRIGGDDQITHFIAIKQDITARKQVDQALRQYAERLQTLHEIDRGVAVAQSPRETAETALRHLRRLMPGEQASVTLFDRVARQMLVLAAYTDQPVEHLHEARFPLTAAALEPLLQNQLVRINDTLEDASATSGPISRSLQASGIRSYITAPLVVENDLIGLLNVGAARPRAFDQDHVDIVHELSVQLAIAIHQAQLREQIQQHTAQLEQRVALRTRELAAANERLQELDALKSKFVAEVSHELRTPVTSLGLYLDLLEHGKPEKHAHYLSNATQQALRMRQLIEDILDLSRLERDRADLTLAQIDLNAVLEQVVVAQRPRAEANALTITTELAVDLPAVRGDINRLRQVATNLIVNAINYTAAGTVRIRSSYQADRARVGFEVHDTGMGIAPEDLPHLFQRFYRGQRASQSSVRGTGLGLNIVKEIVDWHGGEVEVHSEVGVGSTFTVWLPIAP